MMVPAMLDPRHCESLLVYGGSFDPPHRGHVELPFAACKAAGADGVLYVPAGQPPHKPDRPITPAHHRLAMLKLALGHRPDAAISRYELDNPGPSYTVKTLEHLRDTLGARVRLRLLIGADMAACFGQWKQPEKIIELAEPLVMLREPYTEPELMAKLGPSWSGRFVPVPRVDVSSTELRVHLAGRMDFAPAVVEHVHPDVARYIRQHRLYI